MHKIRRQKLAIFLLTCTLYLVSLCTGPSVPDGRTWQSFMPRCDRAGCCLCVFVSFAQEPKGQNPKEDEALFVAKKAFDDGFYDVSLGLLERFLTQYPGSSKAPEANLLLGQCLFHQNRFLDALSKFETLLAQPQAQNIKDALLYWTAEIHFKGNSFSKAGEYYKKIIDEFSTSSYCLASYYSLAWCFFQESKFDKALTYFKIVEEKYPKDPAFQDTPIKIIECLYNLKDYTGLKDRLKSYLKLFSKEPARLATLYFYMAESDYYLNNLSDAIEEYSLVLKNSL